MRGTIERLRKRIDGRVRENDVVDPLRQFTDIASCAKKKWGERFHKENETRFAQLRKGVAAALQSDEGKAALRDQGFYTQISGEAHYYLFSLLVEQIPTDKEESQQTRFLKEDPQHEIITTYMRGLLDHEVQLGRGLHMREGRTYEEAFGSFLWGMHILPNRYIQEVYPSLGLKLPWKKDLASETKNTVYTLSSPKEVSSLVVDLFNG